MLPTNYAYTYAQLFVLVRVPYMYGYVRVTYMWIFIGISVKMTWYILYFKYKHAHIVTDTIMYNVGAKYRIVSSMYHSYLVGMS